MRIKNKDIAKELGISTTAVSLAINNRPGVSEDTRQKVLALLNQVPLSEINYKENNKNSSIMLIVHKKSGAIVIDKPFFSDLISTIQQEAMKQSYSLTLSHFMPGQNIAQYVESIASSSAEGIILLATEMQSEDLQYYKQLQIPIVLLDSSFDFERFDSITLDNQTSILQAIKYAVEQGHRNIGYFKSSVDINNFTHRFDGFMKGIRYFNLEHYDHPVISLNCSVDLAYKEMKQFLNNPPQDFKMPSLFLSDLDYIALGAMQAMKEYGYQIPDDVSIIGYDDVTSCEIFDPPLTTIRVDRMNIGKIAVDRLLQKINTPSNYYTTTQISSELIIRKSVKCLSI